MATKQTSNGHGRVETPPPTEVTKPAAGASKIFIPQLQKSVLTVTVIGESPLVVHKFSEKARKEMLDKQMGVPKGPREKKIPERDFLNALYPMTGKVIEMSGNSPDDFRSPVLERSGDEVYAKGRYGFPAGGIRKAIIAAARQVDGLTMTFLRGTIFVLGEGENNLVEISGRAQMREDTVRLESGVADIRHRPMWNPWSMKLRIQFNANALTAGQVAHLVETAGFSVGIAENRPEKGGDWGRFSISATKEVTIGKA
jgi:hypothetical protein